MKKTKMRKFQIVQMLAVIIGAIFGIFFLIRALYTRVENLESLNLDIVTIIYSLCFVLLPTCLCYLMIRLTIVPLYREQEKDKIYIERLKGQLQGTEKEVRYAYDNGNTESRILKTIVSSYNPHYFVKLANDETVDLIVRDDEGKEICIINISNLYYFREHFEFQED